MMRMSFAEMNAVKRKVGNKVETMGWLPGAIGVW
jgi:hypothetical protein